MARCIRTRRDETRRDETSPLSLIVLSKRGFRKLYTRLGRKNKRVSSILKIFPYLSFLFFRFLIRAFNRENLFNIYLIFVYKY